MECPICWDQLNSKHAASLPCGHVFHEACLVPYFKQRARETGMAEDSVETNCPTCRQPVRSFKTILRLVPPNLHAYLCRPIRRVYLAPPTNEETERARELDHLWSKIEQMQDSLQESNNKAAAAEKKASGLVETLKKERQVIKSLQATVMAQQRMKLTGSRTRDRSRHQGVGVAGPSTAKVLNSDYNARQLIAQADRLLGNHPGSGLARSDHTTKVHTSDVEPSRHVLTSQPATNHYVQPSYMPTQAIPMQAPPIQPSYSYELANALSAPAPSVQMHQYNMPPLMAPSYYAPAPLAQQYYTALQPAPPVNIQATSSEADSTTGTLQAVNPPEVTYQMLAMQQHAFNAYQALLNRSAAGPQVQVYQHTPDGGGRVYTEEVLRAS